MITVLFWLCVGFVLYTYIGYPLLIKIKAKTKPTVPAAEPEHWPEISIIVPVHNEAHHIPLKLKNLQELDYPAEKLSITFVSDGSEDESNELLEKAPGISFISYQPRAGKPTALNRAVAEQTAPYLIFTDARQTIAPDAIKKLIARLLQPGIGAVSGELSFSSPEDATAQSVGVYWKYEKAIRSWESQVHSVAGVTGALYGIERENYVPLYENALLDDFEVPIQILRMGKRVVFENGAFVYDKAQSDAAVEKTRKIRTLSGNFQSFQHNTWLFTRQNPILWQFLSHKVFRLLVPYALALILLTNIALLGSAGFYWLTFLIQGIFYGLGVGAMISPKLQKRKIPNFASVFIKLNWAAVLGLYHYRKKALSVRWEKTS